MPTALSGGLQEEASFGVSRTHLSVILMVVWYHHDQDM